MQHEFSEHHALHAVVVNDDPTQRNILSALLKKGGIEAICFDGADAALETMDPESPPDLIVTDLYMPGIDGWRFCRLLRSPEYEPFNRVPIVVVSATFSGEETTRITADLGADAFLSAPVDAREFLDTVRAVVSGEKPRQKMRVLVVEDSKTVSTLLKKRFQAHGYIADTAHNRNDATRLFSEKRYDIAVLDYHLPDGSGDALLREFHAVDQTCVCVMITADPDPRLALEWMKAGAAAYLRKPFDPDYLIEQCIRACRERSLLRIEDLLEERTLALRESEKKYRELFDQLSRKTKAQRLLLDTIDTQIWYLTDIETYGQLNRSHADFLGMDIKKIAHKGLDEFLPKTVAEVCKRSNNKVFQRKKRVHTEEWIPNAAGEDRLIAITKNPKLDADGNVEYVVCAGMDITERHHLQEMLAHQKQRVEYILEGTNVGTWEWNVETGETIFNARWANIIGYTLEEISPTTIDTWANFCHPEDLETSNRLLQDCFNGASEYYHCECRMRHKNGEWIWVLDRGRVSTWSPEGRPEWMHGTHQDITRTKRLEVERIEMDRRMAQMERHESLSRMSGAIAHLFNNYLAVVLGNLELFEDDLQSGTVSDNLELLKDAIEASRRAAETSQLMLTFLGQMKGEPVSVDLAEACRRLMTKWSADTPAGIQTIVDFPDVGPKIWIDRFHLDQVLSALMINSLESMERNGLDSMEEEEKITVSVHTVHGTDIPRRHRFPLGWEPAAKRYACLKVEDDGSGMADAVIGRIFDPFFTDKFTGRGLGLPVVLGILKASEGGVTVESMPGKGSAFRVFWPVLSEEVCVSNK